MQFWIIEEGEKSGPFEDYRLREMIREGRVISSSKVWYDGAEGWMPADEVSVLRSEFEKKEVSPPPLPDEAGTSAPFLYGRRLGARWFDVLLYQLILFSIYRMGGIDLIPTDNSENSLGMMFLANLPMVIMEGALIGALGFTPGKWLMSLRVTTHEGALLSTGGAILRALRVWVLGMGMSHPILLAIGHLFALWMGIKKGSPLWDLPLRYRVEGSTLQTNRLLVFFALLALFLILIYVLMWPELEPLIEETRKAQEMK